MHILVLVVTYFILYILKIKCLKCSNIKIYFRN